MNTPIVYFPVTWRLFEAFDWLSERGIDPQDQWICPTIDFGQRVLFWNSIKREEPKMPGPLICERGERRNPSKRDHFSNQVSSVKSADFRTAINESEPTTINGENPNNSQGPR